MTCAARWRSEADLRRAQETIELFYTCTAGIEERPIEDMSDEAMVRYSEEFTACARAADPNWNR
jgi:hypothetical protein